MCLVAGDVGIGTGVSVSASAYPGLWCWLAVLEFVSSSFINGINSHESDSKAHECETRVGSSLVIIFKNMFFKLFIFHETNGTLML